MIRHVSRPIEEVVSEASKVLQATGTLDVEDWVKRYPEHEADLREVIPSMLLVHKHKEPLKAAIKSGESARSLFTRLAKGDETAIG